MNFFAKRVISFAVTFAMCISLIPQVYAENVNEDELQNELSEMSQTYPEGAFAFYQSQLDVSEGDGSVYLDVVRYGVSEGEGKVALKAIDVSSKYGEDYTVSVKDGLFEQNLVKDGEAEPLMEVFSNVSDNVVLSNNTETENTEVIEKNIDITVTESDVDVSETTDVKTKSEGLQGARDTFTGTQSDRKSWQEITGNEDVGEMAEGMNYSDEYISEFASEIPGTETILNFKDGEYKKTIKIDLIDDEISESDEQIIFVLYNPENDELAKPNTAYVNISDNDVYEPSVFAMAESEVFVTPDESYATVTIERTSGINNFASVVVGTGDITAKPGVDYEAVNAEIIFPQGVTTRTVQIPVYHTPKTEAVNFVLAIDGDSANVEETREKTAVTILPDNSEESLESYISKRDEAAAEELSEKVNLSDVKSTSESEPVNLKSENKGTGTTSVSKSMKLDLRSAKSVKITYEAKGNYKNSYQVKSGCNTYTQTDTYSEMYAYVYIGGAKTSIYTGNTTTGTYTLNFNKEKNQDIKLELSRAKQSNGGGSVSFTIKTITVEYEDITVTVDNTVVEGVNAYTEKIYQVGGSKTEDNIYLNGKTDKISYEPGKQLLLGQVKLNNSISCIVNKYSQALPLNVVSGDTKTSSGVTLGLKGNYYLAGYQYYIKGANEFSKEIILPGNMNMETLYSKCGKQTSYMIRPVFKPYSSVVMFNNSVSDYLEYTNNIKNSSHIGVTMLDTVKVSAVGKDGSGYIPESFSVIGCADNDSHSNNSNTAAQKAETFKSKASNGKDREGLFNSLKSISYQAVTNEFSETERYVNIYPNKEYVFVDMSYSTPSLDVQYHPKYTNRFESDKGSVVYVDGDKVSEGNIDEILTIEPAVIGGIYNITSAYKEPIDEGYTTVWSDFTGDDNSDGTLSPEEIAKLKYDNSKGYVIGNTTTFMPVMPYSKLYYFFKAETDYGQEATIDGVVKLRDYPIFGDEGAKETPINGATVMVDGMQTVTNYDAEKGGADGKGGDGYFSIKSSKFSDVSAAHRVTVSYGSLSTSAIHWPDIARFYILDAYDTIRVQTASVSKNGTAIEYNTILNDNANYTLSFNTISDLSTAVAQKAVLTFYRTDGSYIAEKEYENIGDNTGRFECTFNPEELNLPPGTGITVKFIDSNNITYLEHDTGIYLGQSLGALSLVSSFVPDLKPVLQIIGTIDSRFSFGWDGNLDDVTGEISDFGSYSITTTDTSKVLNLGLEFSKENLSGGGDDEEDGASSSDAKEAANGTDTAKKQEIADQVTNGKGTSKSELASDYDFEFKFGITLTLLKEEEGDMKGHWYFEEFMLVASAMAGGEVSKTYVTPIGIPIVIGAKIGGSGNAIIVVENRLGQSKYYMSDVMEDQEGSLDLIGLATNDSEQLFAYGDFTISPYIGLSCGVGYSDIITISLSGQADFEFNFKTKDTEKNSGSVGLKCTLDIEILFYEHSWDLSSDTFELFSEEQDGSELYESLDKFTVSEREHLSNRSEWSKQNDTSLFSVEDSVGITEIDLMSGVNPNTNTSMLEYGDNKYISIFVDDVEERSNENSTAVFYSLYSDGVWSEPQIIEDDSTADDSPAMYDLGNGKIFIAWSTVYKELEENAPMLDTLNGRNIHGVFFDTTEEKMSDVIEITKNTDEDQYSDSDVQIAYDSISNKMLIYYTKSEYEASDNEEGVFGDAVYPYSLITYRIMDLNTMTLSESYTAEEEQSIRDSLEAQGYEDVDAAYEQYVKDYYGQRFLNLAPTVILSETLDEIGYWTEEATVTEYSGNDPLVVESAAISYNSLALYAYILDYDGNKSTTDDRDIFLQIYDFTNDTVTHPMMITSNNTEEKNLRFERIGDKVTYLTYLSDGNVMMFDITSNISNDNVTKEDVTESGIEYYYLVKTAESGYIPPVYAVRSEGAGDYSGNMEITDFEIKSDEDYFYIMFTQREFDLKEGVEPGSDESLLAENNIIETPIYMTRYDINNAVMTNPIRVTDAEGINYDNVAFSVKDDGGFLAMATKSESAVTEIGGTPVSVSNGDNSTLCSIDFKPEAILTINNMTINNITSQASASLELYNEGLDTINNVRVEITDNNGNVIDTGNEVYTITGGAKESINFTLPVNDTDEKVGFTVKAYDENKNLVKEASYSDKIDRSVVFNNFNAQISDRGVISFNTEISNNQSVASGKQTLSIMHDGEVLYTKDIEPLQPEETVSVSDEFTFDYDDIFEPVKEDDGSISASTEIVADVTGSVDTISATVSLNATSEQMNSVNAVTDVDYEKKVQIGVDEYYVLEPQITVSDLGVVDVPEVAGLEVRYEIDDESVATIYDSGLIEPIKSGTATVKMIVTPKDRYDDMYLSDYPSYPTEAVKVYETALTVKDEETTEPTDKPSGNTGSGSSSGGGSLNQIAKPPMTTQTPIVSRPVFDDIQSHWAKDSIEQLYSLSMVQGVGESTFEPDTNITRAQYAQLLMNTGWLDKEQESELSFTDVQDDSWYYEAVMWAANNGVTNGVSESTFEPDRYITREEAAVMLERFITKAGIELEDTKTISFTDEDLISDWAKDSVYSLSEKDVIHGRDNGEFAPKHNITRAESAVMLCNIINLKEEK